MKHKKVIDLQVSPRKKRAHSLNELEKKKDQQKLTEFRRISLPQPLDEQVKPSTSAIADENSLYCSENLGNVSEVESKSTEQSSSSSKDSTLEDDESDCLIDFEYSDISKSYKNIKLPGMTVCDGSDEKNFIRRSRLPEPQVFPVENDPVDKIKWDSGIGYLPNSKLHFQFNEFGLLEIMPKDEYRKIQQANRNNLNVRPLAERTNFDDAKRKTKLERSEKDMTYKCSNCENTGFANEFHTPDYCSNICLKQHYERKNGTKASNSPRTVNLIDENNDGRQSFNIEDLDLDMDIPYILKDDFNWETYIIDKPGPIANRRLFVSSSPSPYVPLNRFNIGDKLEAIDPDNSSIIAVATVVGKQGYRVKIHFDGYPVAYDFWTNVDSLEILPAGFCEYTNRVLSVPPHYNRKTFSWATYLVETSSAAAARYCFPYALLVEYENQFKPEMKLEAYDLRNSEKICVASVKDVIGNKLLIHFDGWDDVYDYWVPTTSPYIHQINWHQENGFSLTQPPGKYNFIIII